MRPGRIALWPSACRALRRSAIRSIRTYGAYALLPVVFGALFWFLASRTTARLEDSIGGRDFVAYWAAYRLAAEDRNPYDARLVLDVQQRVFPGLSEPQQYWNPPWILVLLGPVLCLPFEYARAGWFLANVLLLAAATYFVSRIIAAGPRQVPRCAAGAVVFVPVWQALASGQLSILMLFGLIGFLFFELKERQTWATACGAGVMLVLAAVKAHAIYLTLLFAGLSLLCRRRWRTLAAAAGTQLLLAFAGFPLLPAAYSHWQPGAVIPLHWKTPTIATYLRLLTAGPAGAVSDWPVVAIPALGCCCLLVWFFARRCPRPDLNRFIVLSAFSLLTAPYAWGFDHTVLVPAQAALAGWVSAGAVRGRIRWEILLLLSAVQILAVATTHAFAGMQAQIWFPAAVLAVWLRALSLLNSNR